MDRRRRPTDDECRIGAMLRYPTSGVVSRSGPRGTERPLTAVYRLNERLLRRHASRISIPTYDRAALTSGVVHLSVGAFHRSHQAVYFDEIAQRGIGKGWAITGVGLHRADLKRALAPQDGLYTVVTRTPAGDSARVVGALTRYLYAPDDPEAVLAAMADRRTHLVTLTITAGAYMVD